MIHLESMGLGGAVIAAVGALGAYARARNARHEKLDGILANLLANEQAAHARTRDDLSQSRTGESLAVAQAATYGAQVEALLEWRTEMDRRIAESETQNADCEKRYESLAKRVGRVERRVTPAYDTPAVESGDTLRPLTKEEVFHGR